MSNLTFLTFFTGFLFFIWEVQIIIIIIFRLKSEIASWSCVFS